MRSATLQICTICLLGIFAGGCITILFIVVPFWLGLPPDAFLDWFTQFGPVIGITMLPMEILPLIASAVVWWRLRKSPAASRWLAVNVSNILILASLFAYFLPVNFTFLRHELPAGEVAPELERWQLIHALRTILSLISAVLAIAGLTTQLRASLNSKSS